MDEENENLNSSNYSEKQPKEKSGAGNAAKGAVKEGSKGAKEGAEEAAKDNMRNSDQKKSSIKDNLFQLAKKAIRGDAKAVLLLKIKGAIYIVLAVLVFFAMIIEGNAEEVSSKSKKATDSVYSNSTSSYAQTYKQTGSLSGASTDEIKQAEEVFLEEVGGTNNSYYDEFSTKYSGKESSSVANKVKHITTNFEANETKEIDVISEKPTIIAGAITPKDERTIYEHILNTEKYNFNNIIWRSFEKNSGGTLEQKNVDLRLDDETKLQYPVSDTNATNNADLDLNFFLTKVRPYLQSFHIPLDIISGTQDSQAGSNLNTDLAYEIITSAYHEIVLDRYKLEKLARRTNYLIYDKTTTKTTIIRTCGWYKYETKTVQRKAGESCVETDYDNELCKDYVMKVDEISCKDNWSAGCTYGVLKQDITSTMSGKKKYCTDTINTTTSEEKDVREAKLKNTSETDTKSYSWNYLITTAKMFDRVISNKYKFEPYYQYSLDNYNKFINKKDEYANMTVEEYRESEKANSHADDFTIEELDYEAIEKNDKAEVSENWNSYCVVENIPSNATLTGELTTKTVKASEEIIKQGKEYIDKYNWSDNLKFEETTSGIYNVESVKDVTGDDLSSSDVTYYEDLYADKDINIIDLMNSSEDIYKNYMSVEEQSVSTTNIGIRKHALDISYNVLKKDLKELAEKHPLSGLMYGNSLDILEGLNLGMVSSASGVNDAMVMVADSHLGYNLDQMLALNHKGTFFRNHWCAMFVSYCMRTVEEKTGINIPIPNYTGCTTFWRLYNSKPGFFDVQEWVDANQGSECVQSDPTHIAPLSSIQPGDIILYCWTSAGDRDHTAIVKTVEKDDSGNVTKIVTIDGNWGGSGLGEPSYNYSKVKYAEHVAGGGSSYTSLSSIASFVSVSTVLAEAEKGNIW